MDVTHMGMGGGYREGGERRTRRMGIWRSENRKRRRKRKGRRRRRRRRRSQRKKKPGSRSRDWNISSWPKQRNTLHILFESLITDFHPITSPPKVCNCSSPWLMTTIRYIYICLNPLPMTSLRNTTVCTHSTKVLRTCPIPNPNDFPGEWGDRVRTLNLWLPSKTLTRVRFFELWLPRGLTTRGVANLAWWRNGLPD